MSGRRVSYFRDLFPSTGVCNARSFGVCESSQPKCLKSGTHTLGFRTLPVGVSDTVSTITDPQRHGKDTSVGGRDAESRLPKQMMPIEENILLTPGKTARKAI